MKPATALQEFQASGRLSLRWYDRNVCVGRLREGRLGALRYSTAAHLNPRYPDIVPIRLWGPTRNARYEIWCTTRPVRRAVGQGIRFTEDGLHLFGWLAVSETELDDLEEATRRAHVAILRLLDQERFPYWLRAWNYLSAITAGMGERERYRRFNAGRHQVFARVPGFEPHLPAATTVGTPPGSGLRIAFLASRVPGVQIENPRQISAFRYPRFYGTHAPAFSRAVLQHGPDRSLLYVSGTGSIVGHATLHAGDAAAQFDETLANLDALLQHTARQHFGQPVDRFERLSGKLYVRDSDCLAAIGAERLASFEGRGPSGVLFAEFCRRDLLLEIEAVYEWRHQ
jgi:chorismate lyase/3-hydroxybenzoate synthase